MQAIKFIAIFTLTIATLVIIAQAQLTDESQTTRSMLSLTSRLVGLVNTGQNSFKIKPQTRKMLQEVIAEAQAVIDDYHTNGIQNNMPDIPSVPGMDMVRSIPKRVMDAEVTLMNDTITMAKKMSTAPLSASMDLSKDITNLLSRATESFEG